MDYLKILYLLNINKSWCFR